MFRQASGCVLVAQESGTFVQAMIQTSFCMFGWLVLRPLDPLIVVMNVSSQFYIDRFCRLFSIGREGHWGLTIVLSWTIGDNTMFQLYIVRDCSQPLGS